MIPNIWRRIAVLVTVPIFRTWGYTVACVYKMILISCDLKLIRCLLLLLLLSSHPCPESPQNVSVLSDTAVISGVISEKPSLKFFVAEDCFSIIHFKFAEFCLHRIDGTSDDLGHIVC